MPLADKLGGIDALEMLVNQEKVECCHLGYAQGRSWDDSIIYCTEFENNDKEHLKMLLGRVGNNSALWVNGDLLQVNDKYFEKNNGLEACIDSLKGEELFGCVKLEVCERSAVARLADKIV
jgi:predicted ribonuclease YlaK